VFLGRHTPLLTGLRCVEFLTPGFSDTLQNVCCLTKANFKAFYAGKNSRGKKSPKFSILKFWIFNGGCANQGYHYWIQLDTIFWPIWFSNCLKNLANFNFGTHIIFIGHIVFFLNRIIERMPNFGGQDVAQFGQVFAFIRFFIV